jgi:hypothetical protein
MPKHGGFGWKPDKPDPRDHIYRPRAIHRPPSVDLRPKLPPCWDQGQLGSCHDDQTEVLTDLGFRLFAELDGSERLATVDPATSALTFEVPARLIRMPYSGELHCARNQSLNFRVTPDHKMVVRKWDEAKRTLSSDYSFVPAKDLGWYSGLINRVSWNGEAHSETYRLPGLPDHHFKYGREHRDVPMAAWMRFLGIYLAEGTMLKRDQQRGRVSYKIQIAAVKERERAFVRDVLRELGVGALELGDRFTFDDHRVYEAMSRLGLEGVKAARKRVPRMVFRQSSQMIAEFLAGHFAGDGCEQRGMRAHYTSSAGLASDLQTLAFMSGVESRVSSRAARISQTADGRSIIGRHAEHRVSICERKNLSIERKESIFLEDYDGEVFCAEMPTHHTLVTRREGKILISGNCTAFALTGAVAFLHGFVGSQLWLYYKERVLEHSTKEDAGAEIRDGIKVLAKYGLPPEDDWPYDISKFAKRPPAKSYRDAKTDLISEYRRLNGLTDYLDCLASGSPFVVGISVYEGFESDAVARTGAVPMPSASEECLGGHAICVVGYRTDGRFIVRNSWGDWGDNGHFYLPPGYLANADLASDAWTISA